MLSIATLHAVDYYTDAATESFGYYGGNPAGGAFGSTRETDPPGYWTGTLGHSYFGKGATVQREDFAALFFGIDPISKRALTKSADLLGFAAWQAEQTASDSNKSETERKVARDHAGALRGQIKDREQQDGWRGHRAGIDLTFSAPKDFSLLVAAATPEERQRLLAAWRQSVEATLSNAERRYAKTRIRDAEGRLCKEHIAGAAIAMFEHIRVLLCRACLDAARPTYQPGVLLNLSTQPRWIRRFCRDAGGSRHLFSAHVVDDEMDVQFHP